jgi:hypothetical protein
LHLVVLLVLLHVAPMALLPKARPVARSAKEAP